MQGHVNHVLIGIKFTRDVPGTEHWVSSKVT